MSSEEVKTEKLIKEQAKILFFKNGYLKATTQEIADKAGVNRALIHYYFRSREQLLDTLLDEALLEKKERVKRILSSDLSLKEKIAAFINSTMDYGIAFPYLENFIISEIARCPKKITDFCSVHSVKPSDLIKDQLEEEIRQKNLDPISAEQFMVNLIALCNYPLLAKPILQTIHNMTDEAYGQFLVERKQIIFSTIFKERMPETIPTKNE
ncbi:MAG: TetR/AcrR family transcriptional regulator [Cyclobacteriaceae bacterium]